MNQVVLHVLCVAGVCAHQAKKESGSREAPTFSMSELILYLPIFNLRFPISLVDIYVYMWFLCYPNFRKL